MALRALQRRVIPFANGVIRSEMASSKASPTPGQHDRVYGYGAVPRSEVAWDAEAGRPHVARVGVLMNPDNATHKRLLALLEAAAPDFSVNVVSAPARDAADVEQR